MIVNRLRFAAMNRRIFFGPAAILFLQMGCAHNPGSTAVRATAANPRAPAESGIGTLQGDPIISRDDASCVPFVGSKMNGPHILGVVRMYLRKDILHDLMVPTSTVCSNPPTPEGTCLATTTAFPCDPSSTGCTEDDDHMIGWPRQAGEWPGDTDPTLLDVDVSDLTPLFPNKNSAVLIKACILDGTIFAPGSTVPTDSSNAISYGPPPPQPMSKMLFCRSAIKTDDICSQYIVFRVIPNDATFNNLAITTGRMRGELFKPLEKVFDPKIMHQ